MNLNPRQILIHNLYASTDEADTATTLKAMENIATRDAMTGYADEILSGPFGEVIIDECSYVGALEDTIRAVKALATDTPDATLDDVLSMIQWKIDDLTKPKAAVGDFGGLAELLSTILGVPVKAIRVEPSSR